MTRVYQELLTVGRDANEMYLLPVPEELVGRDFVEVASMFLRHRDDKRSCLLIGIQRERGDDPQPDRRRGRAAQGRGPAHPPEPRLPHDLPDPPHGARRSSLRRPSRRPPLVERERVDRSGPVC